VEVRHLPFMQKSAIYCCALFRDKRFPSSFRYRGNMTTINSPKQGQASLFEQAAEGRRIVMDIFEGHEVRSIIDNDRWTALPDIRSSIGVTRDTAGKIVKRIELISPGCSRVDVASTLGETDPLQKAQKITLLNPTGVSLFFQQIHTEKLSDESAREKCRRMQLWMAELSGGVLSGETEKATADLLDHAYDKVDIRVNPIGDVLEQHLKVASLLCQYRNADLPSMVSVAIAETEKDTGRSLSAYQKLLPPVSIQEVASLTPTAIADKGDYHNARAVNKILEAMGLQIKVGKVWMATELGNLHSNTFPYSRNGHTALQLLWKESVLPLMDKFRLGHPDLF
jgi:hypothetical protein